MNNKNTFETKKQKEFAINFYSRLVARLLTQKRKERANGDELNAFKTGLYLKDAFKQLNNVKHAIITG